MNRIVFKLAVAAGVLLLAGAVFDAVAGVVWPAHLPSWVSRAWSADYLAAVLVAGVAGVILIRQRKAGP